jgi:hypothetical protein
MNTFFGGKNINIINPKMASHSLHYEQMIALESTCHGSESNGHQWLRKEGFQDLHVFEIKLLALFSIIASELQYSQMELLKENFSGVQDYFLNFLENQD